jgi:hypothetical protein
MRSALLASTHLESGYEELRELEDVSWAYLNTLNDVEDEVAYSKRVKMYSHSEHEDDDDEEEEEEEEEVEEVTELTQHEKSEEEVDHAFFKLETAH